MKRVLSILLSAILIITVFPLGVFEFTASAETVSGSCGDNVTWEYDTETATLTISGTGAMSNYSGSSYNGTYVTTAPWREYYKNMKTVVINSGVTRVGNSAFAYCTGLTSITIPDSVTSIGHGAFLSCTGLTDVYYTGTEQQKNKISIGHYNYDLLDATWHYNYVPPCKHNETEIKNAKAATCTAAGYTGDTYCLDCGEKVADGQVIPATGHKYVWRITKLATEAESGLKEEICSVCGQKTGRTEEILYTGHITGDINGDDSVNNKDLTRLFQYLSDWEVEVNVDALDVNGDGKVNNKDLTRLFQYLSDWDVEIY